MTRLARLMVLFPDEMLSEIDLYRRYAPDLPPRTEAIRRLVSDALDLHSQSSESGYDPLAKALRLSRGMASG